ncbi:MAG: 4-amino-4-deoxy-L-arabinose transferase [Prochlorococcaceae cyanobacterium]
MVLARLKRLPIPHLLLLLWLSALVLTLVGLGGVPLRDWDEGIVARVALETSLRPWPDKLMPTYWWEAYRNKPPGLHLLIAACIGLWRQFSQAPAQALPPEWVLRIAPAFVSTALVPLLGLIQWRLRPGDRGSALATAAVALTLLPLARHGRLVMLDGCQLVAMAGLWLTLLQARGRSWSLVAWGVGAGLASSGMLLLKAPVAVPVLLGSLLLRSLDRDLRGRQLILLLIGVLLGLLPGLGWHVAHWLLRGPEALQMWWGQGFSRIQNSMEGHQGGPLEPLLEMVEGGGPWLLLWPLGIAMAWRQRRGRWGRWSLGLSLLTAAMVLPLQTQLPWYSLLLWPPFCLVCGPVLAALVERPVRQSFPLIAIARKVPVAWRWIGVLLLLCALLTGLGGPPELFFYGNLAAVLGLALVVGSSLLLREGTSPRLGGAITLVAGCWLSLLLLMASPFWLWELNETWSAPAAARMLTNQETATVVAVPEGERPSLSWYAGRRIMGGPRAIRKALNRDEAVALISPTPLESAQLACERLNASGELRIYHCIRRS